jgi:four helix bundle protein
MGKQGYKDLRVWELAVNLAVEVYAMTEEGKISNDFGLKDQLRRSAVSISSNIAEGDERDTDKDSVRSFYIAKGSLAELRTQLLIAQRIKYISPQKYLEIDQVCQDVGKMLGSLIKARATK